MPISAALGSSALLPAGLGFRNMLINGNFDIWQRGTSFSDIANTAYSADRAYTAFSGSLARCAVTQNTSVPNSRSKYSIKFQQVFYNSSSLTEFAYRQYIEASNAQYLYGQTVTLSFWYRSNRTGSHGVRIDGTYATGGGNFTTTFTVNAADTWEYKVITTTVPFSGVTANSPTPTNAGAMVAVGFCVASGVGFSALNENDSFQISQLQLEANYQPTPFEQRHIGVELALCQRYYCYMDYNTGTGNNFVDGYQGSTGYITTWLKFPQTMRIRPSTVSLNIGGYSNTSGFAATGVSPDYCQIYGYTPGGRGYYYINNVYASAELL